MQITIENLNIKDKGGNMKISFTFFLSLILSVGIYAQQVIENPEEPLNKNAGRVLHLKEEMRVSDEQGGFYFKEPENIKIAPDGSIFVLDEEQFLKFDTQGKFVKNLFRKGQGPGEFMRIGNYLFDKDEIIIRQGRPNKIVRMDMEGNLIRDFRPEENVGRLVAYFNGRYVMARSSFPKLKKAGGEPEIIDVKWNVLFVDEDGEVEKTDHYFPAKWFAKRIKTAIIANYIVDFFAVQYKRKYLVIHHTQDYLLKLLDLEKNKIVQTLKRKYKSVKYKPEKTGEVKVKSHTYTLEPPRDYHNDIQKVFAHKDNLWVLTSTLDRKRGILVDVFNCEAQYIDNFYLPLSENVKLKDLNRHPMTVYENFLFIVEKDENDIPSIIKYKILDLVP